MNAQDAPTGITVRKKRTAPPVPGGHVDVEFPPMGGAQAEYVGDAWAKRTGGWNGGVVKKSKRSVTVRFYGTAAALDDLLLELDR